MSSRSGASRAPASPSAHGPSVPAAVRGPSPGWRDPRLWVGVAIVAASVLLGARLLASADDTVAVWAVAADAGAGDRITEDDLVVQRLRFDDAGDLGRYFAVEDDLPADVRLVRELGAGELLPRAAVGTGTDVDTVEVSLEVQPSLMPTSVVAGAVVSVYLVAATPDDGRQVRPGRELEASGAALSEVTVLDAPRPDEGFGPSGGRQLVLAVDPDDVGAFYAELGGLDAPVVHVVRER